MSDYVIMTDSSCDLPAKLADEMELTVLPLYVDDVCSPASRGLVEEHLEQCSDCKGYLRRLRD